MPWNTSSIDNDAIEFNSNYSSDVEYLTYYNSDSNSINIEFYPSLATLDSIEIVLKSQEITNIYGYNLDGNNDGVGEGDYTIQFSTSMLADFNEDNEISLEDLSAFVIALDNDDFNYELGPFDGQIPNVSVEKDEKFDIEEILEFAIENGATDVDYEENKIEILSSIPDFNDLRDKLEVKYGLPEQSEISWIPENYISLDEDKSLSMLKFLEALDNCEDVQNVFGNFNLDPKASEKFN